MRKHYQNWRQSLKHFLSRIVFHDSILHEEYIRKRHNEDRQRINNDPEARKVLRLLRDGGEYETYRRGIDEGITFLNSVGERVSDVERNTRLFYDLRSIGYINQTGTIEPDPLGDRCTIETYKISKRGKDSLYLDKPEN